METQRKSVPKESETDARERQAAESPRGTWLHWFLGSPCTTQLYFCPWILWNAPGYTQKSDNFPFLMKLIWTESLAINRELTWSKRCPLESWRTLLKDYNLMWKMRTDRPLRVVPWLQTEELTGRSQCLDSYLEEDFSDTVRKGKRSCNLKKTVSSIFHVGFFFSSFS